MSPLQLLKRALVSVLLELARVYALDVNISRDSPDADVKRAYKKVLLKTHPRSASAKAQDAAFRITQRCD